MRLMLVLGILGIGAAPAGAGLPTTISFHPSVTNLEYAAFPLEPVNPAGASTIDASGSTAWSGRIPWRVPGESTFSTKHFVPFVVRYHGATAQQIQVDLDRDSDPTNDPPLHLYEYPALPGARCVIAGLSRRDEGSTEGATAPFEVRIVAEAIGANDPAPRCRLQSIMAMQGEVTLGSEGRRAVLFDGNCDGVYSLDAMDGIFIDLNQDQRFEVALTSEEFGPFRVPFQLGGSRCEVVRVDPRGHEVEILDLGATTVPQRVALGALVPDFERLGPMDGLRLSQFRGRPVVLQFWASWCSFCRGQAPGLVALYDRFHPRGLEIIGISLDLNRGDVESFRAETGEGWPLRFAGADSWEDPVARAFGVDGAGPCYLIDPSGRLVGAYTDPSDLARKLEQILGAASN